MSIDLMGMFKDAVGQQIKGKLSGMLGMDDEKTSTAFDAVSGTVLGGLMKKAKGGGAGATEIFEATEKHDGGVLDRLDDLLGDGNQTQELEKQGGGVLDMVFGSDSGGIISTITKALGLGDGKGGTLMKLLAPLLIGFIGKQLKAKAMDAVGMGKLLEDQSQHLGNYMPAGLTSQLGMSDVVDGADEAVSSAGAAASQAAGEAAEAGGSMLKFLVPILLLGIAALALWLFIFKPMVYPKVRDTTAGLNAAGDSARRQREPGYSELEGVDIDALGEKGFVLAENFTKLQTEMENVSEVEAAKIFADSMSKFSGEIDEMQLSELTETAKTSLGVMVDRFIDRISELVARFADEEITAAVEPVLKNLSTKLKSFTS